MSKSVYVVFARAGEYSDKTWWLVKSFASARRAQEFADRCQAYADNIPEEDWAAYDYAGGGSNRDRYIAACPYDSRLSTASYDKPEYGVATVEFDSTDEA